MEMAISALSRTSSPPALGHNKFEICFYVCRFCVRHRPVFAVRYRPISGASTKPARRIDLKFHMEILGAERLGVPTNPTCFAPCFLPTGASER
jgi:hypothetical protein